MTTAGPIETVEWNLVDGLMSLGKVHRRIDVRAAVLGGEEAVGGVVITGRVHAGGAHGELEPLPPWASRSSASRCATADDFARRK